MQSDAAKTRDDIINSEPQAVKRKHKWLSFKEIQNMSDAELQQAGFIMPPFHFHCRTTTAAVDVKPADGGNALHGGRDKDIVANREQERHLNYTKDNDDFERYRKVLGNNAPSTFAEFQDIRYSDLWGMFKAYAQAIESGELTPLASFELYREISEQIDKTLLGLKTKNGLKVIGKSYHFITRTIGSIEQRRNGVEVSEMSRALTHPVDISGIAVNSNGKSQRFKGRNCYVTINPDTGVLIQVNPGRGK